MRLGLLFCLSVVKDSASYICGVKMWLEVKNIIKTLAFGWLKVARRSSRTAVGMERSGIVLTQLRASPAKSEIFLYISKALGPVGSCWAIHGFSCFILPLFLAAQEQCENKTFIA